MCTKHTILLPTGAHKLDRVDYLIKRRFQLLEKKEIDKQVKAKKRELRKALPPPPFKGPRSAEKHFSDKNVCLSFLDAIRWENGLYCPHCQDYTKISDIKGKPFNYRCNECLKPFNATTGSMFGNRQLPLSEILVSMVYENETRDALTSRELSAYMEYSRNTAFSILEDIRAIGYNQDMFDLTDLPPGVTQFIVEIDIVVLDDGLNMNRHIDKKLTLAEIIERKVYLLTIKVRGGNVKVFLIPDMKRETVIPIILANVPDNVDMIITDEAKIFKVLNIYYPGKHFTDNHSERKSVLGIVHTQGVENFHTELQIIHYRFRRRVKGKRKMLLANGSVFKRNTNEKNAYERLVLLVRNIFRQLAPAPRKKEIPLYEISAVVV